LPLLVLRLLTPLGCQLAVEVLAVDFAHHLAAVVDGDLEGLGLTVFLDRKGCALLDVRLRTPADTVAFVCGTVGALLYDAAHAELTGFVADIADDDTASARLFRNGFQFCVQLVSVGLGQLLSLTLAAELTIAEELAIGLTVTVSANEPSMGRAGVDAGDAFLCF